MDDAIPANSSQVKMYEFSFSNADFANPVFVDIITGGVYEIFEANWSKKGITYTFKNIPVYDGPVEEAKNTRNEAMKEHDHIPLRNAIIEVVRKTNLRILICHEDETEMQFGKDWLLDKLPEDVKPKVVWLGRSRLTDEAISIYKRSAGMFSSEMHSPIMCIAKVSLLL